MSYNFLRTARSIKNSLLCRHDTINGYLSDISINGNFDGWTVFNDVYLYGSWNGTLFGNSLERSCYISRTSTFATPVAAETYYIVKLMMKITDNNTQKVVDTLTTGRLRWTTLNDNTWDSTKQSDFTITPDNKWRLYQINMGPAQQWQGDITNLRIFPFIDGFEKDHFAIKFIRISSPSTFVCTNTSCSYFPFYEHPCPGAGIRASREAGVSRDYYTTTVGNDALTVNINGYGNETFELGDNSNLSGPEMARTITNALGSLNIGSYIFAEAEYSVNDRIKITSGSPGSAGSIVIPYSAAAEALGFYDSSQADISTVVAGFDQATGFDYAASRLFKPFEINKLIDGDQTNFAYIHNPAQLSVEGGRRDFSETGNSRLISDLRGNEHYESLNNKGKTIIDVSHPINNNGRIKKIYIFGQIENNTQSKIKICRPKRDGTFTVVNSLTFGSKLTGVLYTSRPLTYRIDTDIIVEKGDVIGIYNANLYVGVSITGLPDASFYQFDGEVSGNFDPGNIVSLGVAGLSVYARGDRLQTNTILDIDMGDRINIEQVDIYGEEKAQYFEFNLVSCLDVAWSVNLYGNSHIHSGINWLNGIGFIDTHTNIAYGEEALDDMITTPDNGQVGDSATSTPNGIATTGSNHSYFYVNGDAEWLYGGTDLSVIAEYHWPRVAEITAGFVNDPISFTLLFPNQTLATIHKSIMYFKEDDNFRNLELAYYLGTQNALGNATIDRNFQRIPSYTSIRLDGLLYDSTNKALIEDYIFQNPMSDEPVFGAGGIQNPSQVKIGHRTFWNIMEHNFSDIECRGFRIYTDKHNSTKILELEVYSRVATDPALVDNITMSFSDYNEIVKDVEFEEIEEGHVSGFVGGSPRYFTVEMESTNEFSINEIDMSVGDQFKLPDCSDTVLLDHSRRDVTNSAKAVTLENIYDRPFDLIVDLPRETDENDGLVFWSKLESDDDIENPDIGPTCFLHKEDNYDILNDNGQCAINIPAYGLKNLAHNKNIYFNEDNEHWQSLGTLTSGTAVDFCANHYRKTEFTFNPVSSQYWKVGFPLVTSYVDSFLVDPNWSYFNSSDSYTGTFTWDSINKHFDFTVVTDATSPDGWHMAYETLDATITQAESIEIKFKARMTSSSPNGAPLIGMINERGANNLGRPEGFYCQFSKFSSGPNTFDVYISDSSPAAALMAIGTPSWSLNTDYYVKLGSDGAGNYTVDVWTDTWDGSSLHGSASTASALAWGSNKFGVSNANHGFDGQTITGWVDDVDVKSPLTAVEVTYIDAYYNDALVDIEQVYYVSDADNTAQSSGVVSDGVNMDPGPGISAFNTAIGFKLSGSNPIDKIRIIHESSSYFTSASVYINSVNDNTYILWDDTSGTLAFNFSNAIYDTYFVIDLEKRHALDIIRNYGSATTKIPLSTIDNILYGNDNTTNPANVSFDLTTNSTVLLLHCDDDGVVDSSPREHVPTVIGDLSSTTSKFGSRSMRSQTDYNHHTDWEFGTGDFTIDWWMYQTITYGSGKDIISANRLAATSWLVRITSAGLLFYHDGTVIVNISYNGSEVLNTWQHWAVVRDGDDIYWFLNGVQQGSTDTGNLARSIDGSSYLRIWGDSVDPDGYIDEVRISKGAAIWTSNFTPSTVAYDDNWTLSASRADARWLRIDLANDGTDRCIRKLGVYPDIEQNTAIGGGYNCEWESLGNILSNYEVPINVAFGATVTGTNNYFNDWFPENAVDGVTTEFFAADSWGFQKVGTTDPYLEIDFGQTYTINKVKLFHSHDPNSEDYMNTDYNISISTTTSGAFTQVKSVTGNDDMEVEHAFDPVAARRLRFTITGYDFETLTITNLDGQIEVFKGSFLREIEVYTYVSAGSVDSETWPVVCINLKAPFIVINHDLITKDNVPTGSDWDNDDIFFKYSGSLLDEPQKVSFLRNSQYVAVYFSEASSGDIQGDIEYVFDRNQFLSIGSYRVTWEAYDVTTDEEISLRFEGPETVDFFATELSTTSWAKQDGIVQILEDGFYDVKGIQHGEITANWGVRNPLVQKIQGETTWVALTRNTATNYSYNDDSAEYGIDYLDKIKIYGDEKFRPTEYSWWWSSTASTLSNDALNVKVGARSLQIDYTSSSGTDTLAFIEGDDFGQDEFWSPKDLLQFWLKIDDVSKLDTDFGDITFGDINRGNPYYYTWDISDLSLSSGWNLIKLKFDDYASTFPAASSFAINQFLDDDLDFRNNNKDMASFRIRYRGLGDTFTMYLDDIHIERNKFEDDVKFGKGLCLTGSELLEIPAAGLTLEQGAVEFWLKPYYDSYGRDAFGNLSSKTFFTLTNNNNDLISLGLKAGNWFEVVNGNIRTDLNKFDTSNANLIGNNFIRRDEVTHLAIVWSNDSEFLDNNHTIRLYLNGLLTYASNVGWTVGDTKSVNIKFGGGNTQLAYNREAYGSGIFDNIRLYKYAKTNFNINDESNTKDITYTPNQFLEISADNSTFYGVGSDQLPIIFEQVPVGTTKTIYIRSNKNDNFLQSKKTASLIVQWLTTV